MKYLVSSFLLLSSLAFGNEFTHNVATCNISATKDSVAEGKISLGAPISIEIFSIWDKKTHLRRWGMSSITSSGFNLAENRELVKALVPAFIKKTQKSFADRANDDGTGSHCLPLGGTRVGWMELYDYYKLGFHDDSAASFYPVLQALGARNSDLNGLSQAKIDKKGVISFIGAGNGLETPECFYFSDPKFSRDYIDGVETIQFDLDAGLAFNLTIACRSHEAPFRFSK